MKIKVVGFERMEGTAKASGRPYSIGRIHAVAPLDTSRNSDKGQAKGYMGTTYEVDAELIKRIEHNSLPFDAEMTVEDVIRFGKREGKVMDVRPLSQAKDAGAPQLKAA
jgi:hypothetical protein